MSVFDAVHEQVLSTNCGLTSRADSGFVWYQPAATVHSSLIFQASCQFQECPEQSPKPHHCLLFAKFFPLYLRMTEYLNLIQEKITIQMFPVQDHDTSKQDREANQHCNTSVPEKAKNSPHVCYNSNSSQPKKITEGEGYIHFFPKKPEKER